MNSGAAAGGGGHKKIHWSTRAIMSLFRRDSWYSELVPKNPYIEITLQYTNLWFLKGKLIGLTIFLILVNHRCIRISAMLLSNLL